MKPEDVTLTPLQQIRARAQAAQTSLEAITRQLPRFSSLSHETNRHISNLNLFLSKTEGGDSSFLHSFNLRTRQAEDWLQALLWSPPAHWDE